jgi:hypothetical protein
MRGKLRWLVIFIALMLDDGGNFFIAAFLLDASNLTKFFLDFMVERALLGRVLVHYLELVRSLLVVFQISGTLRGLIEHGGHRIYMVSCVNDLIQFFLSRLNEVGGLIVVVLGVGFSELLHCIIRKHGSTEL